MDCTSPGSSVHGFLQARILEGVAIPFSRRSSQPRDQILVSCTASRFFTIWATREVQTKWCVCLLVTQSCLILCHPMARSPPGSSVHRILQARILEWVAISFSRGSSWLRDRTQVSYIAGSLHCLSHWGSPDQRVTKTQWVQLLQWCWKWKSAEAERRQRSAVPERLCWVTASQGQGKEQCQPSWMFPWLKYLKSHLICPI